MHGEIGAPVKDGLLHLFHEHARPRDLVNRGGSIPVTPGLDDDRLGVHAQRRDDPIRLGPGEHAPAGRDPQGDSHSAGGSPRSGRSNSAARESA